MSERDSICAVEEKPLTKVCTQCQQEQPAANFYASKGCKLGLHSHCKQCFNADMKRRRAANPEKLREQRRKYRAAYSKERKKMHQDRYVAKNREQIRARNRAWSAANPEKRRAHHRVQKAVVSGRLKKPECCSRCGSAGAALQAHHDDHLKPLEVRWLCASCHRVVSLHENNTTQIAESAQ